MSLRIGSWHPVAVASRYVKRSKPPDESYSFQVETSGVKLNQETQSKPIPSWLLPAAFAAGAIALAVAGGLLIGPGSNLAVGEVLSLQGRTTEFVNERYDRYLGWLPFGFAFLLGMLAAVNPCGFVMLPAYLTLYIGDETEDPRTGIRGLIGRSSRALYISLTMGLGFVVLFGAAGLIVGLSQEAVRVALPWIGFIMGFLIAALGAYILAGGKLYTGFAQRMADRVGDPRVASLQGYFLFGISYALASLSCTLPLFLSVITSSFSRGGLVYGSLQFVLYAAGMTFLLLLVTLAIASAKSAVVTHLRRIMPYLNAVSATVLIIVGAYLVFYWLTEGDLAASFGVR